MTPAARKKLTAGVGLIAAGVVAVLIYRSHATELRAVLAEALTLCRDAGPLAFFGAMALLPAFGFPVAPLIFAAGPAFGPTLGPGTVIACAALAIAVNVTLSYWIAARLLRPLLTRIVGWFGYRLPATPGKSPWLVTLVVRIMPGPPFCLQSYLLGLARVPFKVYLCVSTLVPLGYITSVVLCGNALARGDRWAAAMAAAMMVVVGAVIHQIRRRVSLPVEVTVPSANAS